MGRQQGTRPLGMPLGADFDLILLMGALMLAFGINWFVNGVWGMNKATAPVQAD